MPVSSQKFVSALSVALLLALVTPMAGTLSGCGGGGGGSTANSTPTTPVSLTVNWAARSRAEVNAPSSAQSFVVTFSQGNPSGGGNITLPAVNRNTTPDAYTQNYVTPSALRVGGTGLTVRFFAEPNGTGPVVAEVINLPVVVSGNGSVLAANSQPLPTITVNNRVKSVEVTANQSLLAGETKQLAFVAKAENGEVIAVSPGSVAFAVATNPEALEVTSDGMATGKAVGVANVTAAVDGVTSAPTAVSVAPATVAIAAGQTVRVGETKTLAVTGTKVGGETIAIPADLVQITVVSGTENLSAPLTGSILGIGATPEGTEKPVVRATVLGTVSNEATVTVELGPEVATDSGLKYQEIRLPAQNVFPVSGKRVRVHYTGYLASNGQKFDSSLDRGQPFEFRIDANQVIAGFNEGVKTMQLGGQRRLLIPSNLGYGPNGNPPVIPPNADLIFDIQLIEIEQ